MVISTAHVHSTKPELRFCAASNPARSVSEIRDGEDLWQQSRLEKKLNAFRRSTVPQKQFIIFLNTAVNLRPAPGKLKWISQVLLCGWFAKLFSLCTSVLIRYVSTKKERSWYVAILFKWKRFSEQNQNIVFSNWCRSCSRARESKGESAMTY